ncbi:PREDICTED: uncharacterized protein LOC107358729 isoform X2 [Acropora digitifera]|uniref:uncharacterized protein LOC107358729 isoform X2 n=1 Tax=Acropora digitifera TaxID=70779 RepID=UPI00077A2341|nr:PREDICTED: uncharacterized protein LOC107358729 isoform X2 [Acropora digitifera]
MPDVFKLHLSVTPAQVMKQLASLLSVWSLCCCFQENLVQSLIPKCASGQMTVQWPNGTFKQCLHCAECQPGRGLSPFKCGDTVTFPKTSECKKCESGKTFSGTYDTSSCKLCHLCAEHEVVTQNCTLNSDTKCNRTCNSDYFFSKPQQVCKRCSYCCLDGKDEEQPQCINKGLKAANRYCSPRPDRTCNPSIPTGLTTSTVSRSSTKHGKIEWILSGVGTGLLFAVILFYCLWRRRRRKRSRQDIAQNVEDGYNVAVVYDSSEGGLMQQEASRLQEVQQNEGLVTSAPSSPQRSRKGIPHTRGFKETVPPVNNLPKNFPQQPDRTETKKGDESARVTMPEDNKYPYDEDDVSDSIVGKGAQGGQERKDSFSDRFQLLCRKLSNASSNYQSLPGEDPDQPIEAAVHQRTRSRSNSLLPSRKPPIHAVKEENTDQPSGQSWPPKEVAIKRSPNSPEVQAGSRVEFRCVVNGCQQVLYRWFKDEQELPGGNNSTLILDPLKMQDFGSYRCEVRSDKRDDVRCVESDVVELDVTPAGGKSYKTLTEVFQSSIYLRTEVANLLQKKVDGITGYKHVASHYVMNIGVLEQCENPGEGVIANLEAKHPDLTVYHFCKILKDKKIRRLDIVNELKGYLI